MVNADDEVGNLRAERFRHCGEEKGHLGNIKRELDVELDISGIAACQK